MGASRGAFRQCTGRTCAACKLALCRRAGLSGATRPDLDLQPRYVLRRDGAGARRRLRGRSERIDRALLRSCFRRSDAVRLPSCRIGSGATRCAVPALWGNRRHLSTDSDAGRFAAAHPDGAELWHLFHAGSLCHRQRHRYAALRGSLARGGPTTRCIARILPCRRLRTDAADHPSRSEAQGVLRRLERSSRRGARRGSRRVVGRRSPAWLRSPEDAAVLPAGDPQGSRTPLVRAEQPPHPDRCLVSFAAVAGFLPSLQSQTGVAAGAALPRFHRVAADPGRTCRAGGLA
ncbi:Uncharacterised protein [Acinetobacter baumannii]|nr:Uncharacterised protein [Acinetobacter baumannii]